jgi:hypothetical protein
MPEGMAPLDPEQEYAEELHSELCSRYGLDCS